MLLGSSIVSCLCHEKQGLRAWCAHHELLWKVEGKRVEGLLPCQGVSYITYIK